MQLDDFITMLGKESGQEFSLQDGSCTLSFDDMQVTFQENAETGQVMLYGIIGPKPSQFTLESLYESLLKANYLFSGTAGASIAMNPDTQDICLCRLLESGSMPYEAMRRSLERFIQNLGDWRGVLAAYRPEESSAPQGGEYLSETIFRV